MNSRKIKLSISCLGLTAYLLSFLLGIDGVVLCLGQDGHIELESAAPNLTCRESIPVKGMDSLLSSPEGLVEESHCGPCKDIPLIVSTSDIFVRVIPIQDRAIKSLLSIVIDSRFTLIPISSTAPEEPLQHFSVTHIPLASLRTVILLI